MDLFYRKDTTLQHFTGVRALNLLPVLHFTVSLNNVIEIII